MPMRGREAKGANEDGPRGAGIANGGEVGSDREGLEQVRVRARPGGEEEEERQEDGGEVRVRGEQGEREEEVKWAEEREEGEGRERARVRGGEDGGGEAAREVVVGRRVRAGRGVVRERAWRGGGCEGVALSRRRATAAVTMLGGGGGGEARAGRARAPEEGSRVR
jgi:hypothetical protein